MKIGDEVRIVKCEACPKVVGKVAKVIGTTTPNAEIPSVEVKFGKGRPPLNRPSVFVFDDVVLILADKGLPLADSTGRQI